MRDAFAEITGGSADRVPGDVDVQLVGSWMFNDRQLPHGGTAAERYAGRDDLPAGERDVARRIAGTGAGTLERQPEGRLMERALAPARVAMVESDRAAIVRALADEDALRVFAQVVAVTGTGRRSAQSAESVSAT